LVDILCSPPVADAPGYPHLYCDLQVIGEREDCQKSERIAQRSHRQAVYTSGGRNRKALLSDVVLCEHNVPPLHTTLSCYMCLLFRPGIQAML
jgi:hypothetical protein